MGCGEGRAGVVGAEDAQVVRGRHLFGQPDVAVAEHGESCVCELVAQVVERFEPFFYVAFQGVVGRRWVGEGGEGVPEEVVVVRLRGDVVQRGIGRALGESFVKLADGKGFVGGTADLLVELIAKVVLVRQPRRLVGRGGEEGWDSILGEYGVFVAEEGRESVLRSTLRPS